MGDVTYDMFHYKSLLHFHSKLLPANAFIRIYLYANDFIYQYADECHFKSFEYLMKSFCHF